MFNINSLNKTQREAVETLKGPLLCLAGAGSGKTTTLTYRVANLIANNVNPSNILLLTFTKKAATDMILKVKNLIGDQAKNIEGGTFHHFAVQAISKFGDRLHLKSNFAILDDNDSSDIIGSLRHSLGDKLKDYKLPNNKSLIFQIISRSRNIGKPIALTLEKNYKNSNFDPNGISYIKKAYDTYKEKNNLLDYDDLLEYLYRLLLIPDINDYFSSQYQYILIDEYQDTNIIQAQIAFLLSEKHNNIMVVGDDAQSIYSFRGSRIENISEFKNHFPKCKVIKLEQNYRSYANILEGCNSLIDKSIKCIRKKLFTSKQNGNKIVLVKCISEKEEAQLVATRILQLYNLGYSLNDIAVLFRNSKHSYELELELANRCIPYKKFGGPKIFDSEHIRNIISYLRILNNPYDKMSWIRILMLIKGIGIQSATSIFTNQIEQLDPFVFNFSNLKTNNKHSLQKLSAMLLNCSKNLNKQPNQILNFVIDYYVSLLKDNSQENLNNIIKELDKISLIANKYQTLSNFLSQIFIDKNDEEPDDSSNSNMSLTLSTIHSAKGLEWKQVFIINVLEGRFPALNLNTEELEEERRLMYVAMTRAMEGLTISYPSGIWDKYSREFLSKPSIFINDISPANLEIWHIKH